MQAGKFLVAVLATVLGLGAGAAYAVNPWEGTIQAYESQDAANPPPSGSVVVVGSSSIVKWTTITSDLYPLDIIPRGFGGSMTSDLDYYLDRIVLKYNPRAVVIYEGDNDINAGITPQAAAATMAGILARISARLPNARVYVISVKTGPARLWAAAQITQLNQLNAALCASDARYTYIDVASSLMYSDGTPIAGYFDTDGVHLNTAGYGVWSYIIRRVLQPQQLQPLPADATAPTAPTGFAASAASATLVNLRWDAASDAGSGLAGYRIYRDGQAVATTTSVVYADSAVLANSSHTYSVTAYDRATPANESARSASVAVTTPASGAVPAVSLSASPAAIVAGATATLSWSVGNASSCTAGGAWSGSRGVSGSLAVTPAATATYSLSCTGAGGSGSGAVTVTVSAPPAAPPVTPPVTTPPPVAVPAPTATLAAAASVLVQGDGTTLSWSSTNATGCVRSGAWTGATNAAGSLAVTPSATSDFVITCTGAGGSVAATARVTMVPMPSVSLTASAATVQIGGVVSLQWSSANAASCMATGAWAGSRPVSGNEFSAAVSGTSDFDLTCRGPYGGTAQASIEVAVSMPVTPAATAPTTTPATPTTTPASGNSGSTGGGGGGFDMVSLLALAGLFARARTRKRIPAL